MAEHIPHELIFLNSLGTLLTEEQSKSTLQK